MRRFLWRAPGAGGCGLRGEPESASSAKLHDAAGPHFDEYGGQDSVSLPGSHSQGSALPKQNRTVRPCKYSIDSRIVFWGEGLGG